ncbi:MAG: VOC family protein [Methyloceanibacter sp.]
MRANPYLTFDGNCEEAFTAYANILGGKIAAMMRFEGAPGTEQMPAEWRQKILHARLAFGDNVLMASDAPQGRFQKMQGMSVTLNIADPAEAERIFAALAEGATVMMPLGETFWALRFGMLTDRFGTPWMINCERAA